VGWQNLRSASSGGSISEIGGSSCSNNVEEHGRGNRQAGWLSVAIAAAAAAAAAAAVLDKESKATSKAISKTLDKAMFSNEQATEMLTALLCRMSISWSRLLPQAVKGSSVSSEGVKFYRAVFKELKDNGIEPAVTLYHWDMPQVRCC
jgi:beta-glucosidase/6-phospho-beta-glucosidase/beta-galactosidase